MNFAELFSLDNLNYILNNLTEKEQLLLLLTLFTGLTSLLALVKSSSRQKGSSSQNLISSIDELKAKLNELSTSNDKFSKDVVASIGAAKTRIDVLETELRNTGHLSFEGAQKKKSQP